MFYILNFYLNYYSRILNIKKLSCKNNNIIMHHLGDKKGSQGTTTSVTEFLYIENAHPSFLPPTLEATY
jgi:hypothetical protein